MKQLTDAEKQELETKIQKEKERQQALRESNPDLPETFEEASAKTGIFREFVPGFLWKYGMLVFILFLVACNIFILFKWKFGYDEYIVPMVTLMLLFNHIAYYFTTKGWKSWVMKTVAWVWIVLVFVYMYVTGIARFGF